MVVSNLWLLKQIKIPQIKRFLALNTTSLDISCFLPIISSLYNCLYKLISLSPHKRSQTHYSSFLASALDTTRAKISQQPKKQSSPLVIVKPFNSLAAIRWLSQILNTRSTPISFINGNHRDQLCCSDSQYFINHCYIDRLVGNMNL